MMKKTGRSGSIDRRQRTATAGRSAARLREPDTPDRVAVGSGAMLDCFIPTPERGSAGMMLSFARSGPIVISRHRQPYRRRQRTGAIAPDPDDLLDPGRGVNPRRTGQPRP